MGLYPAGGWALLFFFFLSCVSKILLRGGALLLVLLEKWIPSAAAWDIAILKWNSISSHPNRMLFNRLDYLLAPFDKLYFRPTVIAPPRMELGDELNLNLS